MIDVSYLPHYSGPRASARRWSPRCKREHELEWASEEVRFRMRVRNSTSTVVFNFFLASSTPVNMTRRFCWMWLEAVLCTLTLLLLSSMCLDPTSVLILEREKRHTDLVSNSVSTWSSPLAAIRRVSINCSAFLEINSFKFSVSVGCRALFNCVTSMHRIL
jgi:hypothetical protein